MNLILYLILWYGFEGIFTSGKYWSLPQIIISLSRKIDEIFILLLLFQIITNFHLKSRYISNSIRLFSILYISILFFSSVINQTSPIILAEYFIRYGKGLIIFIYSIMFIEVNKNQILYFMKYLRIFFLLQFFINGLWFVGIRLIPNGDYSNADWAIGTFGNPFYTSLFTSIVLSGCFYELFIGKGISKRKIINFIYVLLCIIQLIWSDTKHLFFIIPLILFFQLFLLNFINSRKKILLIFLGLLISYNFTNTSLFYYLSDNFQTGKSLLLTSPKTMAYFHSFVTIPKEVPVAVLGAGPGKGGSFIGMEDNSVMTNKYFMKYNIESFRVGNTIMTVPYTGINTIQSELGYIGFGLILFMLFFLFRSMYYDNKYNHTFKYGQYFSKIDFVAFFCLLLFLTENIFADLLQHTVFPILVWFFVALYYLNNQKVISKSSI